MPEEAISLARIVDRLRAHTGNGCFACGLANPIGLHVDGFVEQGGDITARFTARADLQGVIGVLHGGIAATALDEILVWAGIIQEKVLTVTAKLDLRYRRPVRNLDGTIELRARVDERRGRRLSMSGELDAGDGRVAVSASGLYLVSHTVADLMKSA
ncbi:MAG: PaaI family thioesterase [bacterium]|nr:PaaI family thioesterase [bacterium]MDE0287439.1 PaaI family thioesterase [bacterium]MDE0436864.1 PaaI family thioesterase [bacterium]